MSTRIRLRVDIINLFNDRNFNGFNATTGLRNPTDYAIDGPPRTIKLSAGFSF
jgi:outer membrane receptor protein involved in Fe transport